jgi:uncharacterized protein (TIGR03382 family)
MVRWLILVAIAMVARPTPARACSCDGTPVIAPVGTTAPLDTRVIVTNLYSSFIELRLVESGTGREIPTTLDVQGRYDGGQYWAVATPTELLQPRTAYRVELTGELTVDHEFTTGEHTDDEPPAFAGIASAEPQVILAPHACGSSCSSGSDLSSLRVSAAFPADVALVEITIDMDGIEVEHFGMAPDSVPLAFAFAGCLPSIALDIRRTYCVRMTAYDLAGNAAGGEQEICTMPERCAQTTTCDYQNPVCEPEVASEPEAASGCTSSPGAPGALALLLLLSSSALVRRRSRRV